MQKCPWCVGNELYEKYHDEEWGVPVFDDQKLFEMLILEGAQAGLSWFTILKRRDSYRQAFDNFNIQKISLYDEKKQRELLANEGIIRNRLKIAATIKNAKAVLEIQKEFGSFSNYLWKFVGGKPIQNARKFLAEVPAFTKESDAMSKDLKKRGCSFIGSTICYAFMQAVGMVNDHLISCDCYRKTIPQ